MALITSLPNSTSMASTDLFVKDTGSATQKITASNAIKTLLVTKELSSSSVTVAAGGKTSVTMDTTWSGHTPLGIIAIRGTGTAGICYSDWYISGSTLYIYLSNPQSSSQTITTIRATVLYTIG